MRWLRRLMRAQAAIPRVVESQVYVGLADISVELAATDLAAVPTPAEMKACERHTS